MVIEYHNKTIYDCKNVTKRHCTTLWTANDAGEKVKSDNSMNHPFLLCDFLQAWSGNEDDCKDVTWEECNPLEKKVTIQDYLFVKLLSFYNSGSHVSGPDGV